MLALVFMCKSLIWKKKNLKILGYFSNHWMGTRLVSAHFSAFFMLNLNIITRNVKFWTLYFFMLSLFKIWPIVSSRPRAGRVNRPVIVAVPFVLRINAKYKKWKKTFFVLQSFVLYSRQCQNQLIGELLQLPSEGAGYWLPKSGLFYRENLNWLS